MNVSIYPHLFVIIGKQGSPGGHQIQISLIFTTHSLPLSSGWHSLAPPFECPLRIKGILYQLFGFVATTVSNVRGYRPKRAPRGAGITTGLEQRASLGSAS